MRYIICARPLVFFWKICAFKCLLAKLAPECLEHSCKRSSASLGLLLGPVLPLRKKIKRLFQKSSNSLTIGIITAILDSRNRAITFFTHLDQFLVVLAKMYMQYSEKFFSKTPRFPALDMKTSKSRSRSRRQNGEWWHWRTAISVRA